MTVMKGMCRARTCPPSRHGTMYGYQKYRCRCPEAIDANNAYQRQWRATTTGKAWRDRSNRKRREIRGTILRDANGQTAADRRRDRQYATATELLSRGATQGAAARAVGVSRRTLQRWLSDRSVVSA